MRKEMINTIHERNTIIDRIINAFISRESFLILGHKNPDEDCYSSMVSTALILSKFSKNIKLYLGDPIHEHFQYLINICKYNSIQYFNSYTSTNDTIDTIIICDTPKLSMVDLNPLIQSRIDDKNILLIEFDHHIGADSEYIGDKDYSLVTEASSASELVGLLALKLRKRKDILQQFNISNLLSRNLVLSILTGIIGDSNMGKFLKSRREKRYYQIFTALYNTILSNETTKETNFSDKDQVFSEIKRLSSKEEKCYEYFISRKQFSSSIGYVVLFKDDMEYLSKDCDNDIIISVSRSITDQLAEESKKLGLVIYHDVFKDADLIQFRLRRSQNYKSFDVRRVLDVFSIGNGGGHEGAIGFRFSAKEIKDLNQYAHDLIAGIEEMIKT